MDNQQLRSLMEAYRPSAVTIEAMKQVRLVATVGPSAVGKSTIMKALAASDPRFHLVVGHTSRTPRVDETHDVDLSFRNHTEVVDDLKAGSLNQVVIGPSGDLYWTQPVDFPTDKICLFPLIPLGVQQFRALALKFFAAAFIVPSSYELWRKWLAKQAEISNWTPAQLAGRLAEAKKSYEFALSDKGMRFVLNDHIDKAAQRLTQVSQSQTPDDEKPARAIAEDIYARLTKN